MRNHILTFIAFLFFSFGNLSAKNTSYIINDHPIIKDSVNKAINIIGGGILLATINTDLFFKRKNTSTINPVDYKIPLLVTGAGMLLVSSSIKRAQIDWHAKTIKGGSTPIDDYLAFGPNALVFGLDFAGVNAKHNLKDRLLIATMANSISIGLVYGIKYTTNIKRPDNSTNDSFPSGHTAFAFTGAQIIHEEYGQNSIVYSIAGYGIGATVGVLRMVNNRHWVSDIVAGAGIGMLSTKLAYRLLPWAQKKIYKNNKLAIMPVYLPKGAGFSLAMAIK
jgi:membrane-associated phospholipid phosphatase